MDAVSVSDIATRLLSEEEDGAGDVWFAIKAAVRNNKEKRRKVDITLQAVDQDGFELYDITLGGILDGGETKILTEKSFIAKTLYQSIRKWQQK